MASLGLSIKECAETFTYLRTHLPHVENDLLQELAGNFAYTALADLDAGEFRQLLDVPGPKITLRGSIKNDGLEALNWKTLFPRSSLETGELLTVASALMIITTGARQPFRFYKALYDLLSADLHPATESGIALYEDLSRGSETSVLLVLSGVGTSSEVLDAGCREATARQARKVETKNESSTPEFGQVLKESQLLDKN